MITLPQRQWPNARRDIEELILVNQARGGEIIGESEVRITVIHVNFSVGRL